MADKNIDNTLEDFKKLVRKAIFLTQEEEVYFNKVPNERWAAIFVKNFDGNLEYANRVLLNKFSEIEQNDTKKVDLQKQKIFNLDKSAKMVMAGIDAKLPILFLTDIDNDGSLAQAIINEYLKIDKSAAQNMHVEYAQVVNGNANRGFTVDLIDKITQNKGIKNTDKFLIITADNGINSREEQIKVQNKYPNIQILITDHHNPEDGMVIEENDNTLIFNPHYKKTPFFEKYNISGAATVGVLLKEILTRRYTEVQLLPFKQNIRNINKISKVSNVLDYVDSHPADKPEKDYVVSRFLELQPLLNINNSISKMITGEISLETIDAIRTKIPKLDVDVLLEEAKNIKTQNSVAKILLKIYKEKKNDNNLKESDFVNFFMKELNDKDNYIQEDVIDENYIGQLRPVIFNLTADDEKTPFFDRLNEKMIDIFENVKTSEKKMANELRAGEVITKKKLPNSTIAYTDKNILSIFNRKFLNKVYNDENPGFALTLDSVDKGKVSGSFRSLYNISDILKDKQKLEKSLNVKIETPGHEKAAGFIIRSNNADKNPITDNTIEKINDFVNASIVQLKANEIIKNDSFLLTDLETIHIIDRINLVVRGNVANFERLVPLIKLTPDTISTDTYTTEQFSMQEIVDNRKYGYITINTNFHGDTVIIPVELIRKIVNNNYEDYLSLNYMDGGVFMAERVISNKEATKLIDIRTANGKTAEIAAVFEKDFKDKNIIDLTREQIKDNPFFKYHDYGDLNFDLFEKMVIGIIDTNKIDILAVFDVEANGFGNARLMNFGATNYSIDEESGKRVRQSEFYEKFYYSQRGEEYLLTREQVIDLKEISVAEKEKLPLELQQQILVKFDPSVDEEYKCYLYPSEKQVKIRKKLRLPFEQVSNFIENDDGTVIYNRSIKADMLAYLVKDKDFKTGQEIINLTGINQELLEKHGKDTSIVDQELSDFYTGKKVLFGAHNTPYDSKIIRANMPKTYDVLKNSHIYDSALFSKEHKLAYDFIQCAHFENISGVPKTIYFYHNDFSDFNLKKLLESGKDGYYPDRSGRYLLEVKDSEYFLVDKEKHEKVKIQSDVKKLLIKLEIDNLFEIKDDNYVLRNKQDLPPVAINKSLEKILKKLEREKFNAIYELKDSNYLLIESNHGYEILNLGEKTKTLTPILNYQKELMNNLTVGSLPNTAVKYSVEKLSEQWMIHALLLSDEKFKVDYVDTSQNKYSLFKDRTQDLVFLQDSYHFDTSPKHNLSLFQMYYEQKNNKSFLNSPAEEELLNDFMRDFLDNNRKIQQKFSDAWMYKKVLEIKDPTRIEITKDLVDLVNYQTNIPTDKINTIFDEAIKFKEKYKISHILQHELHVNGLWEGDKKGDVAFEDKLTLSLLAQRMYDAYTHDERPAIDVFNREQLDARKAFDLADALSDGVAQDSYSFRQGLQYDRDSKTKLVQSIQAKELNVTKEDEEHIIKFKLDNDILDQDNAVYAIAKKGSSISRENIESDKEKLSFILLNQQIKNSLEIIDNEETRESMKQVLEANTTLINEHKEDLAKRYRYVEFNKRDFNIKKTIDIFIKALEGHNACVPLVSDEGQVSWEIRGARDALKIPLDNVDAQGFGVIKTVITNYVNNFHRIKNHSMQQEEEVLKFLTHLENKILPTTLELALADPSKKFNDFGQTTEENFLAVMETKKTKPLSCVMDKHGNHRMINKMVESYKNDMNPEKNFNNLRTTKPKP